MHIWSIAKKFKKDKIYLKFSILYKKFIYKIYIKDKYYFNIKIFYIIYFNIK